MKIAAAHAIAKLACHRAERDMDVQTQERGCRSIRDSSYGLFPSIKNFLMTDRLAEWEDMWVQILSGYGLIGEELSPVQLISIFFMGGFNRLFIQDWCR